MTTAERPSTTSTEDITNTNFRKFLVADLFCGAGGSSTGAAKAIASIGGEMELVAVNHWPVAVETHQLNHPTARHYVESLEQADPEIIVPEGRLDLLMASPECRFYSKARGGRPILDQGRMNPWIINRWLTSLNVRNLIVENVPEFKDWGPLGDDHRPIRSRKGTYFESWVRSLWDLGYKAEWKDLNAADYGDATTRVRFFLIARNDGLDIRWPEATHSKIGGHNLTGYTPKWRGAREIIDWSNQGRSLLDDPKYRKKPLSINTRRRIAKGLERYGGPLAHLYIRLLDLPEYEANDPISPPAKSPDQSQMPFIINRHGDNGSDRVHPVDEPMPTATTRGAGYVTDPILEPVGEPAITGLENGHQFIHANRNENAPKAVGDPVPSPTTANGGGTFIAMAKLAPFMLGQQSGAAPRETEDPIPTVAKAGAISLVQPSIIQYFGQSTAQCVESPLSTILSNRKHALIEHTLVEPTLVQYFGQSHSSDIEKPVPALTTKDRYALAHPTLLEVNHQGGLKESENGRTHPVENPLATITSKRATALADPTLVQLNHGNGKQGPKGDDRRVQSVDEPLRTITTSPGIALADPVLVKTSQTGGNGHYTRPTDLPAPTITTQADIALATPDMSPLKEQPEAAAIAVGSRPYLVPNFGERPEQEPRTHDIDAPLSTVTSHGAGSLVIPMLTQELADEMIRNNLDPRRLVLVDGQPWMLDIRFRMLQNDELARAMGFEDEEIRYEFTGTATQITKQIGNAVPVNTAAALVRATLGQHPEEDPGETPDDAP